jgi:hypothetical protein
MTDNTHGFKATGTPQSDGSWLVVITRGDLTEKDLHRIYGFAFKFKEVVFTDKKARASATRMLRKIRAHVSRYEHRTDFEVE